MVIGGIHDKDLRALLGYDLGVAITGTEQVGFTLIFTEGFGTIPMAGKTFTLLSSHAGRKPRFPGPRKSGPESFVRKSSFRKLEAAVGTTAQPQRDGIRVGDPVRIIRDPLFGGSAKCRACPPSSPKLRLRVTCACWK